MKKYFKISTRFLSLPSVLAGLLTIILASCFSSCQKSPINGDLDGMWQVMDVSPKPEENLLSTRLYYNFSLHVCTLSYYGGGLAIGNLTYDGEYIMLDFPFALGTETRIKMRQYGIYTNPVIFKVEYLDKSKLILKDGDITVTLRKF